MEEETLHEEDLETATEELSQDESNQQELFDSDSNKEKEDDLSNAVSTVTRLEKKLAKGKKPTAQDAYQSVLAMRTLFHEIMKETEATNMVQRRMGQEFEYLRTAILLLIDLFVEKEILGETEFRDFWTKKMNPSTDEEALKEAKEESKEAALNSCCNKCDSCSDSCCTEEENDDNETVE